MCTHQGWSTPTSRVHICGALALCTHQRWSTRTIPCRDRPEALFPKGQAGRAKQMNSCLKHGSINTRGGQPPSQPKWLKHEPPVNPHQGVDMQRKLLHVKTQRFSQNILMTQIKTYQSRLKMVLFAVTK